MKWPSGRKQRHLNDHRMPINILTFSFVHKKLALLLLSVFGFGHLKMNLKEKKTLSF
jgi:hypothetical protein